MWNGVQRDIDEGELLPAIVVSESPCVLAVLGNLTIDRKENEPCHAIKIVPDALNTKNCPDLKIGLRLPVTAIYEFAPENDTEGAHRYFDFMPTSLHPLTDNLTQIGFLRDQIGRDEWHTLEKLVKHLPDTQTPALHILSTTKAGQKRKQNPNSTMQRMISALWACG